MASTTVFCVLDTKNTASFERQGQQIQFLQGHSFGEGLQDAGSKIFLFVTTKCEGRYGIGNSIVPKWLLHVNGARRPHLSLKQCCPFADPRENTPVLTYRNYSFACAPLLQIWL
ncbi:hypothetical protein BaRGS_00025998 [Batillaria attramentaria]|uniref:Uncharacterized protein n=1 Tax=Batillaria attramentaria TaxID=370345 RepID=A0ABD0K786_9CAEN